MIISLDCTKLELLGEENDKPSSKKSKQKHGTSNCRRKKRVSNTRSQVPLARSCTDCVSSNEVSKEKDLLGSKKTHCSQGQRKEIENEDSKIQKEHAKDGKNQPAARKGKKNRSRSKTASLKSPVESRAARSVEDASSFSVLPQEKGLSSNLVSNNSMIQDHTTAKPTTDERSTWEDDAVQSVQENIISDPAQTSGSIEDNSFQIWESVTEGPVAIPPLPVNELNCPVNNEDTGLTVSMNVNKHDALNVSVNKSTNESDGEEETLRIHEQWGGNRSDTKPNCSLECFSYEWPTYSLFSPVNSNLPTATDRLHLEVGHNWHGHSRQSFVPSVHHARKSVVEGGCNGMLSQPLAVSLDWPPAVRSACGLAPSASCNYDPGFFSRRQSAFQQGFAVQNMQLSGPAAVDDERNYSWDFMDVPDAASLQDLGDEGDNHWISEEEMEVHTVSGIDYNQYFGGGVMYWNPSDHPGTGFSRPPSLSSDDSSWAWREADMARAVDEMVAFSSSYSTNGLSSPSASSFCSPFDPLGPGHQALGYVMPGNEVSSKMLHSPSAMIDAAAEEEASRSSSLPNEIDGNTGDSFPYPILRPIIIPSMSRERSRSEFKRNHDHKSPRVPPGKREQLRIKRPPSPVVLSVPRAPRPPPPSPVSDSRKHRGFPTVRSGSSSPRHWGIRGWYQEGTTVEEVCLRMDGPEVVWPSWRNKNLSAHAMIQPLPGALLQDHLIAMSQLARDQEHPDVAFPLQRADLQSCPSRKESLSLMHSLLNDEIECFCKQVAGENMARKPYINWAVKRVTRSLQVLWPRSRTNIFGSNATGLSLPSSDVDLVVCLPPVRNLEPIKEAGILEGRNGIKETCLQHAARYLANQEWVKSDSLKTVENTAIPIIMLVVEVPHDFISSSSNVQSPKEELNHVTGDEVTRASPEVVTIEDSTLLRCSQINHNKTKDSKSVRLDISFKTPSHTGLQTTELVKELTEQFPAAAPLALILKKFLADRSLDQSYSGGLSSYCLVLLIIRFLQHEYHLGRPINQNFGSLLMDFLYFFGNVFDPRQMRISVQGSGIYLKRERGYSIDPLHIDDPLYSTNNVGRNCFRIHQCIKAFSEAYSVLEDELECLPKDDTSLELPYRLLRKIIPSIDLFKEYKA